MIRRESAGVVYDLFASLEAGEAGGALLQAVLTRHGGRSAAPWDTLNLGHLVGDDPAAVAANHARVYAALGLSAERVVTVHQVHGDRVARVSAADGGRLIPATDALICDTPGLTLLLRFADCVPVLLYDPVRRAVGLAHAGWQGTLAGIAGKTALALQNALGCRAEDIRAGIGPSIGPCCCEMGPDVLAQFRAVYADLDAYLTPVAESASGGGQGQAGGHRGPPLRARADGRARLDLWRLNARQLAEAGVRQIEIGGVCTVCHTQDYYSHRGEQGRTGRFGALIGLRPPQPAIEGQPWQS